MLTIFYPNSHSAERIWILTSLMDRFSAEYELIAESRTDWKITAKENSGSITLVDEIIPSLYEENKNVFANVQLHSVTTQHQLVQQTINCFTISADIFGMAFWAMSRFEETNPEIKRDTHGRIPASSSLLHKENLLKQPFIDEWMKLLFEMMLKLWPTLKKKTPVAKTYISCDVDTPYEPYIQSFLKTLRKTGGDLMKRKSIWDAIRTLNNYSRTRLRDYSYDQQNTFNWIMDVNENAGNRVTFYFLVENTVPEFDAMYSIDEPRIRQLIRSIHERGHEIGLHGSYGSYKNGEQLKRQFSKLSSVLDEENVDQEEIGIRQHYLRWSTPETPNNIEAAGLCYDTTLGFADHAGFRCGTCYEYPMFDLKNRQQLNLIERPLVVMECSVLDKVYMGLDCEPASDYMQDLKNSTKQVGGNFTLLWHNSQFKRTVHRQIYESLI